MYFFFFNDTATTEIYTLSLHDALPIFGHGWRLLQLAGDQLGDRAALALDEGDVAEQRLALEPLDHGRDPGVRVDIGVVDLGGVMAQDQLGALAEPAGQRPQDPDRKSTRLNSSHANISYAVFCLKKK